MSLPQLPILNDCEKVSTSVTRILGGNPGKFTLQGTNTYLILPPISRRERTLSIPALLIDTGQGCNYPHWRNSLREALAVESSRQGRRIIITRCILSHWHEDHIGGLGELRDLIAETKTKDETLEIYKFPLFDEGADTRDRERRLLTSANGGPLHHLFDLHDGEDIELSDPANEDKVLRLRILHTPGHTSDHVALLVVSSPDPGEVGCIFTADSVLGHGTAVFEDLALYTSSLQKMKEAIQKVGRAGRLKVKAFPGHGAVIEDAVAKIDEYIAHRAMREQEVIEVLKSPPPVPGETGWTSLEIVKVVYKNVPVELHDAAERGVKLILAKLEAENIVERFWPDDRWRLKGDNAQPGVKAIL